MKPNDNGRFNDSTKYLVAMKLRLSPIDLIRYLNTFQTSYCLPGRKERYCYNQKRNMMG